MGKPVVSGPALRVGVRILGVVVPAIAVVLHGVDFAQLVAGGAAAWKSLATAVLLSVGGALFGWTVKWFEDFSLDELPLEWRESLTPEPIKVTNDVDADSVVK